MSGVRATTAGWRSRSSDRTGDPSSQPGPGPFPDQMSPGHPNPFRQMAAAGWPLPMLTVTLERALPGPVSGAVTVWSRDGVPASLHCRKSPWLSGAFWILSGTALMDL